MDTTGFEEVLKNTSVYVLTEVGFCYSFHKKWALTKQELVDYFNNKKNDETIPERCCLFDRTIGEVPQKTTREDVCWYYCIDEYPLEEIIDLKVDNK